MKSLFLVLVFLAALFEATGDVLLKKWALEHKDVFFYTGLSIYFIATVVWAYSLKFEFLSKAISIVTILNMILVVLVGVLYFKEDLTLINKIGIILGIVSVVLIDW